MLWKINSPVLETQCGDVEEHQLTRILPDKIILLARKLIDLEKTLHRRIALQPAFSAFEGCEQVISDLPDDVNQLKLDQPVARDGLLAQQRTKYVAGNGSG